MSHSSSGILKPCYLFAPGNLLRRLWLAIRPVRNGIRVVSLLWGGQLEVDLADSVGREIFTQRIFDISVSECAGRLINPGDHVVDAGANIGYMSTLFAAMVGKSGRVDSFEPHPKIRQKLEANLSRNAGRRGGTGNVTVHSCALGEQSGEANLVETEYFAFNQGTAKLAIGAPGEESKPGVIRHPVQVETLDDLFPSAEISLLKIDVEGHELQVIRGARRLLKEKRIRHVIYEDHAEGNSGLPETFASHGYTVFSIGRTLRGLELRVPGERIALDTSWESPSYLATSLPDQVRSRIGKGWKILSPLRG